MQSPFPFFFQSMMKVLPLPSLKVMLSLRCIRYYGQLRLPLEPCGTSSPYIRPLSLDIPRGLPCSPAWLPLRVTPATPGALSAGSGSYCQGRQYQPSPSYMGELPNSHDRTLTGKSYVLHGIRPGIHLIKKLIVPAAVAGRMEMIRQTECCGLIAFPPSYFGTSRGCDKPRTASITHRFSCGPPSTKHSLLIQDSDQHYTFSAASPSACTTFMWLIVS
jgi:hypothetical protein